MAPTRYVWRPSTARGPGDRAARGNARNSMVVRGSIHMRRFELEVIVERRHIHRLRACHTDDTPDNPVFDAAFVPQPRFS